MNRRRNSQLSISSIKNHTKKWREEFKTKKKLQNIQIDPIRQKRKSNFRIIKKNSQHSQVSLQNTKKSEKTLKHLHRKSQCFQERKLFEQENILGEDVLKLQNLICGGYIDDEETFLSLDKFIKKKDEFVLLNDLYDRTQKVGINKKISVKELSKRDMFSILYIKENMRNLNRSDIKYLSDKLKIVI